jgi:glyoxylate reductase
VLYYARSRKPERDALGDEYVSLETLMKQSDFVSLHCPHTPETHGLISREMIRLMKKDAFLINTARGPVVDEGALIEALRERGIAGAGLDVYTGEPVVNPAFFELDNVLLTPHCGSNTLHARNHMAEAASRRILAVLRGELPENLLNPEALN